MEFNILTYNFFGRPNIFFKDGQGTRSELIASAIKQFETNNQVKFDVIFFQEVFNDYKIGIFGVKNKDVIYDRITNDLGKLGFKYFTDRVKHKVCPLNGGAFIISRHKILDTQLIYFRDSDPAIENAMASKGICYAKIRKGNQIFNLINLHLDSFDEKARFKQMQITKLFIREYKITDNIIIGGDYNIDFWGKEFNNVGLVFSDFNIAELNYDEDSFNKYSMNSIHNDYIKRRENKKKNDEKNELLDMFIYCRGKDKDNLYKKVEMEVIKLQHEHKVRSVVYSTSNHIDLYALPNLKLTETVYDLSDHYPVWCKIKF